MNQNTKTFFSTQKNPFSREIKPQGFYHPSSQKQVSKKNSDNAILVSKNGNEDAKKDNISNALQLMDMIDGSLKPITFDEDSQQQNESGSSKYDESWSSTLPSFHETPVKSDDVPTIYSSKEHSIEDFIEQQGTLSKFVQRFRKQPPLSREQREERSQETTREFWWLQNKAEISSEEINLSENSSFHPITTPPKPNKKKSYAPSLDSPNVGRMQSRADKLLEMSGSTLNEGPLSDNTTTLSRYQKTPTSHILKRKVLSNARYLNDEETKTNPWILNERLLPSKPKAKPKPENDILYQWRLARKMEIANQEVTGQNPFLQKTANVLREKADSHFPVKKVIEDVPHFLEEKPTESTGASERTKPLENGAKQPEKDYEKEFIKNNKHLQMPYYQHQGVQPCFVQPMVHAFCHGNCLCLHNSVQNPAKVSTGVQVENVRLSSNRDVKKGKKDVNGENTYYNVDGEISLEKDCESSNLDEKVLEQNVEPMKPTIPVINEVISKHLFPEDMISIDDHPTKESRQKNSSQDVTCLPEDSSEENDFRMLGKKSTTSQPSMSSKEDDSYHCEEQKSKGQIHFEVTTVKDERTVKPEHAKQLAINENNETKGGRMKSSTPISNESSNQKCLSINALCDNDSYELQQQKNLLESSSEEEYCDDEILNELRKNRKEIKTKLKGIQTLLSDNR